MTIVGLLARPDLTEATGVLHELIAWLHGRGIRVAAETRTAALITGSGASQVDETLEGRALLARVDALVVLGGDGTLLGASHLLPRAGVPVVGVNFGSLGFLTEVTLADLYPTLHSVLDGTYQFEERRLLHGVVRRAATHVGEEDVLNDVVVTKASLSRMLELEVRVDGRFVSDFRADGLILSSPTGSTAYNLAAGGPIVDPRLPALVLTPICPQTLTHRPLVLRDDVRVEMRLKHDADVEAHVTFDGQRGFALDGGETIEVTRSERTLRLVKVPSRDYFEVLRTKLKWGEPPARRR
jgi:NAD+ kinase